MDTTAARQNKMQNAAHDQQSGTWRWRQSVSQNWSTADWYMLILKSKLICLLTKQQLSKLSIDH